MAACIVPVTIRFGDSRTRLPSHDSRASANATGHAGPCRTTRASMGGPSWPVRPSVGPLRRRSLGRRTPGARSVPAREDVSPASQLPRETARTTKPLAEPQLDVIPIRGHGGEGYGAVGDGGSPARGARARSPCHSWRRQGRSTSPIRPWSTLGGHCLSFYADHRLMELQFTRDHGLNAPSSSWEVDMPCGSMARQGPIHEVNELRIHSHSATKRSWTTSGSSSTSSAVTAASCSLSHRPNSTAPPVAAEDRCWRTSRTFSRSIEARAHVKASRVAEQREP